MFPPLYQRMVKLGREMVRVLVVEYGPDAFVRRIADPVWFQSLGTVLSFDWNASGLTTILTAALKEAIRNEETVWSGTATSSHHSWGRYRCPAPRVPGAMA